MSENATPHSDLASASLVDASPPPDASQADTNLTQLSADLEAILISSDKALTTAKLAEILTTKTPAKRIEQAIAGLNEIYQSSGRSFRIESIAGGWQIMTLPAHAPVIAALAKARQSTRLTPAALETLAIVAYKQPILRAQIESIRGVACGEVLRSLMERHLVKIVGRSEEIGRPMLYGTTRAFLELFGLGSIKDLPRIEDFRNKLLNA